MTTRVTDTQALQSWLNKQPDRYVVLREKHVNGALTELNLLADFQLAERIETQFPRARRGVKVDVYGKGREDYLGFAHLPDALAEACLRGRVQMAADAQPPSYARWYRAQPMDELQALLYHLCYHKPDKSGFAQDTVAPFNESVPACVYTNQLQQLGHQTGTASFTTLPEVHAWLSGHGLALDALRLQAYVRYQFAHGKKSYFHAWLMNQAEGELNLFVIRGVAIKHKQADALLERLSERYRVMVTKAVPLSRRLLKMRHMRGGKWKRGGKPHLAVVVFDPGPLATTAKERQVHPFVFNARQFVKREWREWFTAQTGARPQDNPIHSTDNEAEAIGHLPLFFDDEEQRKILADLSVLRSSNKTPMKACEGVS